MTKKISELTAETSIAAADKLVFLDADEADGSNNPKTITIANFGSRAVFLTSPLTSTSWDGDSFSTTSKTKIDLSSVFSVPAGVKAVLVAGTIADSGSATADCSLRLSPNDIANQAPLALKIKGVENSYSQAYSGIVPCDSNGDIYYQIVASGTGTMAIILQIWGYWV